MIARLTPLGPTARAVAANIRARRATLGLSYEGVVARLQLQGHYATQQLLSRIELGQRRVDVDDLVALAAALDTTPAELLTPASTRKSS
uniref:helix-turn-helix domain-containing protein n=1 Tax=Herbidospora sakaeratensis TaxID=564415 RepID=UPI0007814855|nr:helix-turn-helix transcriptional regulator [Herbidospora sakaeratensis]